MEDLAGLADLEEVEDLEDATTYNNISRQLTHMHKPKYHAQHTN